jgi:hypothetical protein
VLLKAGGEESGDVAISTNELIILKTGFHVKIEQHIRFKAEEAMDH